MARKHSEHPEEKGGKWKDGKWSGASFVFIMLVNQLKNPVTPLVKYRTLQINTQYNYQTQLCANFFSLFIYHLHKPADL